MKGPEDVTIAAVMCSEVAAAKEASADRRRVAADGRTGDGVVVGVAEVAGDADVSAAEGFAPQPVSEPTRVTTRIATTTGNRGITSTTPWGCT